MCKVFFTLILICFISGTASAQRGAADADTVISKALLYFNDVIHRSPGREIILIDSTTEPAIPFFFKYTSNLENCFEGETLFDGLSTTSQIKKGLSSINFPKKIKLLSGIKIDSILKKGEWQAFYNEFANYYGFYSATQPFIDYLNGYAAIIIENHCGDLCGEGYVFVFQFNAEEKAWKIVYKKMIWVS